jgi:hypothetical protein
MEEGQGIFEVLRAVASLDPAIKAALYDGTYASVSLHPPKALGLDIFLCALYRRQPDQVLQFFNDSDAFAHLNKTVWPSGDIMRVPEAPESTKDRRDFPEGTAPAWNLQVDADLERILLSGARMAFASLRNTTTVADLAASIASDAQVSEILGSSWGITLKG